MEKEIWVVIISGIFTSIVAPFVVKLVERMRPPPPPSLFPGRPRWSLMFLQAEIGGIVGGILGYLVVYPLIFSPCPLFAPTRIEITSPVSGSKVSRLTTIQGTACHLPNNKELWILVISQGITAYYPQQGPVIVTNDGKWTSSVYVGLDDPVDVGREFVLVAVLADNAGSAAIRQYFSQASTSGQIGLEPLPGGIQLITQVQVIRK